jgi:cold shock CspA family protein
MDALLYKLYKQYQMSWIREINKDYLTSVITQFYQHGMTLRPLTKRLNLENETVLISAVQENLDFQVDLSLIPTSDDISAAFSDFEVIKKFGNVDKLCPCLVSKIPRNGDGTATYCFAIDQKSGMDVFIHFSNVFEEFSGACNLIEEKQAILAITKKNPNPSKGLIATRAFIVDSLEKGQA